jgi:hypothetical protein
VSTALRGFGGRAGQQSGNLRSRVLSKKNNVDRGIRGGRWKLEGGSWKVEGGRWKVEGGRWKAEVARALCAFYCDGLLS